MYGAQLYSCRSISLCIETMCYARQYHGRSKFENILNLAAHTRYVYGRTAVTPPTIVMVASVRISGDQT